MDKTIEMLKNIPNLAVLLIFLISVACLISSLFVNKKFNLVAGILLMIAYIAIVLLKDNKYFVYLILSTVGIFMLFMELMVPGVQVFGLFGLAFLGVGFYGTFDDVLSTILGLSLTILIAIFLIYYYIKKGYKVKGMEKFILNHKSSAEEGYLAVDFPDLTGKRGVTTTPLRPSGFGIIDDKKYDLYSYEGFIPKDTKIEVIKVESMKIYVRRI